MISVGIIPACESSINVWKYFILNVGTSIGYLKEREFGGLRKTSKCL